MMDDKQFQKNIKPFYWVDFGDGCYSVCLYVCLVGEKTYKEEIFDTRRDEGFCGSGYDWTSLAMLFMKDKMPEFKDRIDFDPEHSMFCARSYDKSALQKFVLAFKKLSKNNDAIQELFSRVPDTDYHLIAYVKPESYLKAKKARYKSKER